MNEQHIVLIKPCKQIKFFDILTRDIHSRVDEYSAAESTTKLNIQEVFSFISGGGDWDWKVVEHNNAENVFMSGSSHHSLQSVVKGEEELSLGFLEEEEEVEEIHKLIKQKMRVRYADILQIKNDE